MIYILSVGSLISSLNKNKITILLDSFLILNYYESIWFLSETNLTYRIPRQSHAHSSRPSVSCVFSFSSCHWSPASFSVRILMILSKDCRPHSCPVLCVPLGELRLQPTESDLAALPLTWASASQPHAVDRGRNYYYRRCHDNLPVVTETCATTREKKRQVGHSSH